MNRKRIALWFVAALVFAVLMAALGACTRAQFSTQGVTNFDSLTLSQNLVVGGTADLKGNLADSGGAFTIADNVMIDGAADAEQLVVQGYSTQTNKILVVENSSGTDKFTVDASGNVVAAGNVQVVTAHTTGAATFGSGVVTGTLDVRGPISGDAINYVQLNDNTLITGTLGVSGKTSLAGALDVKGLVTADGYDYLQINENTVVTGTLGVSGNGHFLGDVVVDGTHTWGDSAYTTFKTSGQATLASAVVTGTLDARGPISGDQIDVVQLNDNTLITGTLGVSGKSTLSGDLDVRGLVSSDAYNYVQINENTVVTGTLGVSGVGTFGTFFQMTKSAPLTVVQDVAIVPTASFMALTAAGGVSTGLSGASSHAGAILVLYNGGAQTITISDTVGCNLSADVALTAGDALTLISDGTNWIELAVSAN